MKIIQSKQKKALQKKLKHQKQVEKFQFNANHKYTKQLNYQRQQAKNGKVPLVVKLKYSTLVMQKDIPQHYDFLISERVRMLRNPKWSKENLKDNPKDNRIILANLNYAKIDGYNIYNGIVIGYRIVNKTTNPHLYLLLGNVYGLTNAPARVKYKDQTIPMRSHFATDHLWIDGMTINSAGHKRDEMAIGLGDAITFTGKVNAYRGKRENIKQTKYGVDQITIIDSGYPEIMPVDERNLIFNDFELNIMHNTNYKHRDYLIYVKQDVKTLKVTYKLGMQVYDEDRPLLQELNQKFETKNQNNRKKMFNGYVKINDPHPTSGLAKI